MISSYLVILRSCSFKVLTGILYRHFCARNSGAIFRKISTFSQHFFKLCKEYLCAISHQMQKLIGYDSGPHNWPILNQFKYKCEDTR